MGVSWQGRIIGVIKGRILSLQNQQFEKEKINVALVRRLLAAQFPEYAALTLRPAVPQGWDNRSFRLGGHLVVRLPSAAGYTPQVEKEHRWLPYLAERLPLPIPVPVAKGQPGEGFPWPWSIYRWIEGETVRLDRVADLTGFAGDLAAFLAALQKVDPTGGPPPGPHSFFRGGPLETYDQETRLSIQALRGDIDATAATEVWETALAAKWRNAPVWFHGDVAVANLLLKQGRLGAVIDFGCSGVGDPACDTVIAWTFFSGDSRAAFKTGLPLDAATWARGRGWALWKALITLAEFRYSDLIKAADSRRVIKEVLEEHKNNPGG